jgi:hypothetical protein
MPSEFIKIRGYIAGRLGAQTHNPLPPLLKISNFWRVFL